MFIELEHRKDKLIAEGVRDKHSWCSLAADICMALESATIDEAKKLSALGGYVHCQILLLVKYN